MRGNFTGRQVPDELARFARIAQRVLRAGTGETDNRRLVAEGVEKAIGREIQHPLTPPGRYPADRPGTDDRIERIVGESMPLGGLVVMTVVVGLHTTRIARKSLFRSIPFQPLA